MFTWKDWPFGNPFLLSLKLLTVSNYLTDLDGGFTYDPADVERFLTHVNGYDEIVDARRGCYTRTGSTEYSHGTSLRFVGLGRANQLLP
jgi:hypothetical protein